MCNVVGCQSCLLISFKVSSAALRQQFTVSWWYSHNKTEHNKQYCDVIMGAVASQITSLTIVYSTVYSDADQRKHQSSASLAFLRGIHRGPVNSPHIWPVTRKMFPFDDVIMKSDTYLMGYADCKWLTWHSGCWCGGRIEGGRTWIKNSNNIAIWKRSIPLTGSKEGYSLHKLLFCMLRTASNAVCHLDNSISNWLFQVKQSVHITDLKFSCSPWTGYNFHEVSFGLLSSLMASRDIFCMLCICSSCKVSFDSTVKEICSQFVLCCGLL